MKIKQAIASIALATAFAATFASAAEYTWNGTDGGTNDWQVAGNWLVDGSSATDLPGSSDTALFDTSGSKSFSATNMPTGNIGTFLQLKGDGQVGFENGGKLQTDYGFEALDSVSLTLNGPTRFYPWNGSGSNEWNSSGTFTTDQSDGLGVYFNSYTSFRQTDGIVLINGSRMLRRGDILIDGGEMKSTSLFGSGDNNDGRSIDLRGGDLTQSGSMSWGAHSDINIEDGVFTVNGEITFNTVDGELNFATDSTGSFVSQHTESEILGFISGTNLTVNGAVATAGDFDITDNGDGTRTVALIPEPATLGLLGIFGLVYLLQRKLNN